MKTVRLTLRYDAATIHPMHRFVAESDAFDAYRMVHGNFAGDDDNAFIFHVVGDPDVYEAALADTGRVSNYELTRTGDRTFTVYVRDLPPRWTPDSSICSPSVVSSSCRRWSTGRTGRSGFPSSANRTTSGACSRASPTASRRPSTGSASTTGATPRSAR